MNFLNEDNIVFVALNKIGDIVLANLLFILCSIPLVTIGPSLTALYHCMLRTVKGNNNGTVKTFFLAFRQSFRQSLIVWLGLVVVGLLLFLDTRFLLQTGSETGKLFYYLSGIVLAPVVILALYVFSCDRSFFKYTEKSVKECFHICLHAFSFHTCHRGNLHSADVYDLSGSETAAAVCMLLVFLRIWTDSLYQFIFLLSDVQAISRDG